ncbi:hypothetical protein Dimus_009082, partial [Dionaea muscipula]
GSFGGRRPWPGPRKFDLKLSIRSVSPPGWRAERAPHLLILRRREWPSIHGQCTRWCPQMSTG